MHPFQVQNLQLPQTKNGLHAFVGEKICTTNFQMHQIVRTFQFGELLVTQVGRGDVEKLQTGNALDVLEPICTERRLVRMEFLDVSSNTNISDADVAKFTALTNLRELNIGETPVTDDVFKALAEMENLEILWISGNGLIRGNGLQFYTRSKP